MNPSFPTLFVTVLEITIPHTRYWTQDSQTGTATTLRDEQRWNLSSILKRCLDLSHLHSGQYGSDDHPASYAAGTKVLSSKVKQPGRQSDHSPTALRLSTGGMSCRRVGQRYHALVRMCCCYLYRVS